jgi:uracil-DNA glycosylase family 4
MHPKNIFDQECRLCPRLDNFLCEVKQKYPDYHARPVSPFGDGNANLLIVGLAPGMHGANASGRPFTGDYAGLLLYETLYQFGFSNKPSSDSITDGLELKNCRITNAVKCLPPQNKPTLSEIDNCNNYLASELKTLPERAVVLALGTIAHRAVLKAYALKLNRFKFSHHAQHGLPDGRMLVDSYHSSRYNVQTKRLTKAMFDDVFYSIQRLLKDKQ